MVRNIKTYPLPRQSEGIGHNWLEGVGFIWLERLCILECLASPNQIEGISYSLQ